MEGGQRAAESRPKGVSSWSLAHLQSANRTKQGRMGFCQLLFKTTSSHVLTERPTPIGSSIQYKIQSKNAKMPFNYTVIISIGSKMPSEKNPLQREIHWGTWHFRVLLIWNNHLFLVWTLSVVFRVGFTKSASHRLRSFLSPPCPRSTWKNAGHKTAQVSWTKT